MQLRVASLCLACLLAAGGTSGASGQFSVSVFGEGTISLPGGNVFRGQFSADGTEFWFFRKVQADEEDYRIFLSHRTGSAWSEPVQVSFGGAGESEMYPTPTPDGRGLVFTSYRRVRGDTSSHANANLWYVERRGDGWKDPILMRGASTLAHYESQPWFDRAGTLHFTSTTPDWRRQVKRQVSAGTDLSQARWQDDPLIEPWSGWNPEYRVVHATPNPAGDVIILEIVPISESGRAGTSDLWVSVRKGSTWSEPVRLGEEINSPDYEAFAVFTPDGDRLLFVRGFEQYWQVPVAELVAAAGGGSRR